MPLEGHALYCDDDPVEKRAADESRTVAPHRPQAKKQEDESNQPQEVSQDFTMTVEQNVSTAIPEWPTQLATICVVPGHLARGNLQAYTPAVVCIGPFFNSQRQTVPGMLKLESYKWCCVRKLIVRRRPAGTEGPATWTREVHAPLLRKCLETIGNLVPRIRASYSISSSMDTISSDSHSVLKLKMLLHGSMNPVAGRDQLAQMMLIDGCFILHRLLKYAQIARSSSTGTSMEDDDDDDWTQMIGQCGVWGIVTRDLLLLNNQIPFFVIRELFEHLRGRAHADEGDDALVIGGLRLFRSLHPRRLAHSSPLVGRDVHHLLHLFYLSVTDLPTPPSPDDPRQHQPSAELPRWVPCAKELEEAGVTFRARKDGATSFLDLRFHGGILEIPPLELYDYSEPLFRNLIAFEQTYLDTPGHVTAYAIFMDCLVKTHEDMRILHQSGVLVNHMNGEREAAIGFFSRICAEAHTSADRNYLAGLMDEVIRYQSGKWPQWRAALVRDYFTNPWVTIAVVAAVTGLSMTVLQSFYAVYAYYKPPS